MFTYYGTKKKIARYYPKPKFHTIIEPFAGAAMYSLYGDNWEKNVILNEKYDKVFQVWSFLINDVTVNDIENLPDLKIGMNLDNIKSLSDQEKNLLGFFVNPSSAQPKKTVTERGEKGWGRYKKDLLTNLHKIKHWKIYNLDYSELSNINATWFIDPPYQSGGQYYHSTTSNKHLSYDKLSEWCLNRNGEIIVCENSFANWLPFVPLVELKGQLHKTTEVIYHKIKEHE